MRDSRKNIALIIIVSVIIAIIVISAVGAYLYLCTDLLKSNEQLFTKYFGQTMSQVEYIFNTDKVEEISEKNKNKNTESEMTVSLKSDWLDDISLINKKIHDYDNKKVYNDFKIVNDTESLFETECIITENAISLRLTDIVDQFLTVEDGESLEKLADNLEIEKEQIEQVIDMLKYKEKQGYDLLTKDEINNIKQRYMNILIGELSKNNFSKQKDVMITINGNTITTNSYILTMTAEQYKNILKNIIEQLKNEEIILKLIDKITEEYISGTQLDETFLKQSYVDVMDEMLEEIKKVKADEDFKIVVYEQNKNTVRIKIEQGLNTIIIDPIENEQLSGINLKMTTIEDDTTNTVDLAFTKYKAEPFDLAIELKSSEFEDESISCEIKVFENENKTNYEITIELKEDDESVKILLTNEIIISDEAKDILKLNSSNNIVLNNLTKQRLDKIFKLVSEAAIEEYAEMLEPINEMFGNSEEINLPNDF